MTISTTMLRGFALALLAAAPASAQTYPSKPIRMIVPISPGSVTDVAARLTAQELSERLGGQPVIVVNRPGASMVIGGTECANSAPDGYTLCVVSPDVMSFNPYMVPNLPYDPARDFRPVINMYNVLEGIITPSALPPNSLDELRQLAVQKPGQLNYGTLGARTATDAFRQWMGEHWKTGFVAIPYKGGSEIIGALLGRTIDVAKIGVGNMAGQLNEGKLKVLSLRGSKRSPILPNVPTFDEAGLGSFPGGPIFWGVVVPAGTPDPIVRRLHTELQAILRGPKFTDFAAKQFLDPVADTPEEFAAFLKRDLELTGVLIKKYMSQ